jgi:hypothetical protein
LEHSERHSSWFENASKKTFPLEFLGLSCLRYTKDISDEKEVRLPLDRYVLLLELPERKPKPIYDRDFSDQ